MPTSSPSFTGLVVKMEISTEATSTIDDNTISELETLVAQAYGADVSEVTSSTEYVTAGSLLISTPDNVSHQDTLHDLTSAFATSLGITEDFITLSIDPESGEVFYSISTSTFDETANILDALESDDIVDLLAESTNLVDISNVIVNDEIVAQTDVMVNGDNITVPLQQGENVVNALLDNQYDSNMEGNHFNLKMTFFSFNY